jgi:hypothetical protein
VFLIEPDEEGEELSDHSVLQAVSFSY